MATIILVPGFWLDASSWDEVVPALRAAGHDPYPVTLPGLESADADRTGIGLQDHIDAVVAVVDSFEVPVVLVGHSGGGPIVHGVTDRRPDRVSRVVYVDSGPGAEGTCVNDELPHDGVDLPLPEWSVFGEEDLRDLTPELLDAFAARAVPTPAHAAIDPLRLHDERRYDVPVTVVSTTFPRADLEAMIAAEHPFTGDLVRIRDVSLVELPTGHWPQLSKPDELARAILDAL